MALLITKGYGSLGDGSLSTLITVKGFGETAAVSSFSLVSQEIYIDRIELVFSANIFLSGPAALPAYWTIDALTLGAPIPSITSVLAVGTRIKIYHTEARNGAFYALNIPPVGIKDIANSLFPGPFVVNYAGVGQPPYLVIAGADDGQHVKVIFNEPVQSAQALIASNYVITGGGGLTVFSVTKETDQVYELYTSPQAVGQTYTLTVSNILDLLGNPI